MSAIFRKNIPIKVAIPGEGGSEIEGRIFGNIEGKGLLAGGFGILPFQIGAELLVRIQLGGTMVGFWATVVERLEIGGGMYLLSIPQKTETLSRRELERLPVLIPAQVALAAPGGGFAAPEPLGILTDLSMGGCGLASGQRLAEETLCRVTFSLPGTNVTYLLEGKIVRETMQSARFFHGVEFMPGETTKSARPGLGAWIDQNWGLATGQA